MKKVLYVIDSLQTGGSETSTLDIASRLTGFIPVVCHIYQNDFLKPRFEERGIKVLSLGVAGKYSLVTAFRRILQVLRDERPDLVVSTLMRSELVTRIACKVVGIPNVGTFVYDTYSKYEWSGRSILNRIKIGAFWILDAVTARLCTGFLSNSESIKESNCRSLFIPTDKVEVIYRGRIKETFAFRERALSGTIKFLAVGRLIYRKGFQDLIRAFVEIRKSFPGSTLTIAGEGREKEKLQVLVDALGLENCVSLVGNVADMAVLMDAHDVFVFPSHAEGFSGTIVEAMFSGICIVASDILMTREALHHQYNAVLFEAQNVKAIEDGVLYALSNADLARLRARNARSCAEEKFDIGHVASQHKAYYKRVSERYVSLSRR